MVYLSQGDKPKKVAWSVQPQPRHTIDHLSMVAQEVKRVVELMQTLLCEHTSCENYFKFLKPKEIFNRNVHFRLKFDPEFLVKPP